VVLDVLDTEIVTLNAAVDAAGLSITKMHGSEVGAVVWPHTDVHDPPATANVSAGEYAVAGIVVLICPTSPVTTTSVFGATVDDFDG
jgi:hypothetical protein